MSSGFKLPDARDDFGAVRNVEMGIDQAWRHVGVADRAYDNGFLISTVFVLREPQLAVPSVRSNLNVPVSAGGFMGSPRWKMQDA